MRPRDRGVNVPYRDYRPPGCSPGAGLVLGLGWRRGVIESGCQEGRAGIPYPRGGAGWRDLGLWAALLQRVRKLGDGEVDRRARAVNWRGFREAARLVGYRFFLLSSVG